MSGPQWGPPNQPGEAGRPQWGQPPQGEPRYDPSGPGETQYGEPQYGQPQYGQPQYGQPQYGQPQYGQPQYGQPQYGQPQYGQPQYGPPQYGQPPAGRSRSRRGLLLGGGAVVVAGVVVLVLFATGVLGGDGDGASSPGAAVRSLLEATKSNDVSAARSALCRGDQALSTAGLTLTNGGRLTSYTIGATTKQGADKATVHATAVTGGKTQSADIPTVREGGRWKVCFTVRGLAGGSGGSGSTGSASSGSALPAPPVAPPSVGLPTSLPDICLATGTPSKVAEFYVLSAQIGSVDAAQQCVYQDTVSRSTTAAIKQSGVFYALIGGQSDTGSSFRFRSVTSDASLRVSVTKEPDGHYYVTGVTKS